MCFLSPVSEKVFADLEFRLKRAEFMRNLRAKKKKNAGKWTEADEARLEKTRNEMNEMLKVLAGNIASKSPSPPKPKKKAKKVKKNKVRKRLIDTEEKHKKKKHLSDEEKRLKYNAYMSSYMKERTKKRKEQRLAAAAAEAEKEKAEVQSEENEGNEVKEEVDTSVIVEKPFKMVVEVQNNLLMAAPDDDDDEASPASQKPNENGGPKTKRKQTEEEIKLKKALYARRQRARIKKEKGLWTDEDEYRLREREYGILPGALKPDPSLLRKKSDESSLDNNVDPPLSDAKSEPSKVETKAEKTKKVIKTTMSVEEKREKKNTYLRLHRVELKKNSGEWTDKDEVKFVAREGKSSDEVIRSFRDGIKSYNTERRMGYSKAEMDKKYDLHMQEFKRQLTAMYGGRDRCELTESEKRDRHNAWQRESKKFRKKLENEKKEFAAQRIAKRAELARNRRAQTSSWTETDKKREKERDKKQMQYQQKRKVLLNACRKKSSKVTKIGRGGCVKISGTQVGKSSKSKSTVQVNGGTSVEDTVPLTNGESGVASMDSKKSLVGTSRGRGRGRGRGAHAGSLNRGLPNGIKGVSGKKMTVSEESSRMVTKGRGRGVRGRGRGRGAKNLAAGDATHAVVNGNMRETTGRGQGRGKRNQAGADNIITCWSRRGDKRGFISTGIHHVLNIFIFPSQL